MPTADKKPVEGEGQKPAAPDPRDARIAELEQQLAEIRRPSAAGVSGPPARLKVEPPHSEVHHAGIVIGTEFTEVPANRVAALMEAAEGAGVTLTQDLEG